MLRRPLARARIGAQPRQGASSSSAGMTRFKFSGVDLSTGVHPGAKGYLTAAGLGRQGMVVLAGSLAAAGAFPQKSVKTLSDGPAVDPHPVRWLRPPPAITSPLQRFT